MLENLLVCFYPAQNQIIQFGGWKIQQSANGMDFGSKRVIGDAFTFGMFAGSNLDYDKLTRIYGANRIDPLTATDLVISGQRGFFNVNLFQQDFPQIFQTLREHTPTPAWNNLVHNQHRNNHELEQHFQLMFKRLTNFPMEAKNIPLLKILLRLEQKFHGQLLSHQRATLSILNLTETRNHYHTHVAEMRGTQANYCRYAFLMMENELSDNSLAFLYNVMNYSSANPFTVGSFIYPAQAQSTVRRADLETNINYASRLRPQLIMTYLHGEGYLKGNSHKGKMYMKGPKDCSTFEEIPSDERVTFSVTHSTFQQPLLPSSNSRYHLYNHYTTPKYALTSFPRPDIRAHISLIKNSELAQYLLPTDALQADFEPRPSPFFPNAQDIVDAQFDVATKDGFLAELKDTTFETILPIFQDIRNPILNIRVDQNGEPSVDSATYVIPTWMSAKAKGSPIPGKFYAQLTLRHFQPAVHTDPSIMTNFNYEQALKSDLWNPSYKLQEPVTYAAHHKLQLQLQALELKVQDHQYTISKLEKQLLELEKRPVHSPQLRYTESFKEPTSAHPLPAETSKTGEADPVDEEDIEIEITPASSWQEVKSNAVNIFYFLFFGV